MSKVMLVASKEYKEIVHKKSFLIGLLLTPAIIGAMMFLPVLLAKESETPNQRLAVIDLDRTGIVSTLADTLRTIELPDGAKQFAIDEVESYSSPEDSEWQIRRKEIDSLVQVGELNSAMIVYPDLVSHDSIVVVSKAFDVKAFRRAERAISSVLINERLSRSKIAIPADSIRALTANVDFNIQTPKGKQRDFDSIWLTNMLIWIIIYMTILIYGQTVMRSIIEEKNSRISEVMVSSVTPFELMMGKLVGLCGATLTQLIIWVAIGAGLRAYFGGGGEGGEAAMGALSSIFNPVFITFFCAYFVLGFFLYAGIFATIGAVVNNEKETQNILFPVMMLLVFPFILSFNIAQSPDKPWVVIMSLIPFFSSILMALRLNIIDPSGFSFSEPVIWQAVLGLVILLATTIAMTWVSARIFRIGILMYGKRPTMPELMRWVRQS